MSEQGSLSPIYPLGVIYPTVTFFFRSFLSFFSFSACKLSKRYFYTFLPNQFLAQVKFSFSSILFALSLSYIKRFVRCNLYDSQSVFKFILRFTIIQVLHTKFIKVVLTEYSAFKSSSKMIQEQAVAAVTIALISEKNKSRKKRKKKKRLCETFA